MDITQNFDVYLLPAQQNDLTYTIFVSLVGDVVTVGLDQRTNSRSGHVSNAMSDVHEFDSRRRHCITLQLVTVA